MFLIQAPAPKPRFAELLERNARIGEAVGSLREALGVEGVEILLRIQVAVHQQPQIPCREACEPPVDSQARAVIRRLDQLVTRAADARSRVQRELDVLLWSRPSAERISRSSVALARNSNSAPSTRDFGALMVWKPLPEPPGSVNASRNC